MWPCCSVDLGIASEPPLPSRHFLALPASVRRRRSGRPPNAAADMCLFASKVFGTRFDVSAIVGEQRRLVSEVCGDIDFSLPVPNPKDLVALDPSDLDGLAEAFTGVGFDDAQAVGDRLLRHRITASLLRVAADHPRRWPDAVAGVAQQVQEWGMALGREP